MNAMAPAAAPEARPTRPILPEELVNADERVLTAEETSVLLGVSVFTLLRKRQERGGGDLPWVRLSAKRIGYRLGDVKAWLLARRQGALPETPPEKPPLSGAAKTKRGAAINI
jgi:hypothetical protein